jgi:hypothetical protein
MTLKAELDSVFLEGHLSDFDTSVEYAGLLLDYSQLAWRVDEIAVASLTLKEATDRLSILVNEKPEYRSSRRSLANAWFENWVRHNELPAGEAAIMIDSYLVGPDHAMSCEDAALAARLELMRGNISLAKDYTDYLLNKGFYESGFVDFCRRYDLCTNIN